MNTAIVKVPKPIVMAIVASIAIHYAAQLIANHCLLEMSIKFQEVVPLKSTDQPEDFSGIIFFVVEIISFCQRSSSLMSVYMEVSQGS